MDPALDSLHLDILQADAYAATPDWTRYGVVDPFARLYLLTRGEARVEHEGRAYVLHPGELHLLPARRSLDHICDTRAEILYVHFTARVLGSLDLWEYLPLRRHVPDADAPGAAAALRRVIEGCRRGDSSGQFAARGALMELLGTMMGEAAPRREPPTALLLRFGPVFEYIDAHLGEDMTVARLSRVAHLERSYFSTLFRQAVGESPARYVRRRRVERAQRLLYLTDRTLESIADELGFCDAFHLSRSFKRLTGRSPRAFRGERALP